MAVVRCDDYSPYGMTCPQCNNLMIAPEQVSVRELQQRSTSLELRHLWL
jgi:hypothetical protein